MQNGFVDVGASIPNILTEVRYATNHNLTGAPLAGYHAQKIFLTKEAAQALAKANHMANQVGYQLLLYDGYRPQKAVDTFVSWAAAPEDNTTKAEFYPNVDKKDMFKLDYIAKKSGHTRGSTIDLTLVKNGQPVDMGTAFDFMDEKSHHGAKGLSMSVRFHRLILKNIMALCGFRTIPSEWWHYTLINEPYPDKYFNFDIE